MIQKIFKLLKINKNDISCFDSPLYTAIGVLVLFSMITQTTCYYCR